MNIQSDTQHTQEDADQSLDEQKTLAQPMGPPTPPPPQPPPRSSHGKRGRWFIVSALLVVLLLIGALVSVFAVQMIRRPVTQTTPASTAATVTTPRPAKTTATTPTPVPTTAATPSSSGSPPDSWTVVESPNVGASNQLNDVAAVSADNLWAVGFSITNRNPAQTLIEHWNGTNWKVVSSPNPSTANYLYGVAAASATDLWAVGYTQDSTLIEHFWNGNWQVVASPNVGTGSSQLTGVAALSPTNVWAVGYSASGYSASEKDAFRQTLIEHWDGTSWQVVSSPNPGTVYSALSRVTALSASDIWTVGYFTNGNGIEQTLIEHWNGSNWQAISSPNVGAADNQLFGVTAVSPTDIWAVGFYRTSGAPDQTLIEHWDGTSWQVVSSPSHGTAFNFLGSVAAVSPTSLWAVGYYENNLGDPNRTLIEHWNGTVWTEVESPDVGTGSSMLSDVVALSPINIWAVGYYAPKTLTEQYS